MRPMRSRFALLLAALAALAAGVGPLRAQALDWAAGDLEESLTAARVGKRPLLVFVYVDDGDPKIHTQAEQDSERLAAEVLTGTRFAAVAGGFVLARVNYKLNETIFDDYDVPERVPCIIFIEPETNKAYAHCSGVLPEMSSAQLESLYTRRLTDASSFASSLPRARTPPPTSASASASCSSPSACARRRRSPMPALSPGSCPPRRSTTSACAWPCSRPWTRKSRRPSSP
jgi:hypothetical protein